MGETRASMPLAETQVVDSRIIGEFYATYPGFYSNPDLRQVLYSPQTGIVDVHVKNPAADIPENSSFDFGGNNGYRVVGEMGVPPEKAHLTHSGSSLVRVVFIEGVTLSSES